MSWAECECGLVFTSDSAFDRHFATKRPELVCKTASELEAEGWRQNSGGRWTNRPILSLAERPAFLDRVTQIQRTEAARTKQPDDKEAPTVQDISGLPDHVYDELADIVTALASGVERKGEA